MIALHRIAAAAFACGIYSVPMTALPNPSHGSKEITIPADCIKPLSLGAQIDCTSQVREKIASYNQRIVDALEQSGHKAPACIGAARASEYTPVSIRLMSHLETPPSSFIARALKDFTISIANCYESAAKSLDKDATDNIAREGAAALNAIGAAVTLGPYPR